MFGFVQHFLVENILWLEVVEFYEQNKNKVTNFSV
jgi:hypothetical protein